MARFPFVRSPGEQLRQLFQHDRVRAQSRQLGYSSISPGEGLLEIRDAAGSAIAGMGHEAGKSGFLVRRGGAWVTVQEHIAAEIAAGTAELGSRMSSAEGRLDSHAARLGSAEGRLDSHAGRLGSAEGRVGTLEGRADSHAARIGAAEGRLNDHASRLGAVENVNSSQTTKINQTIDYAAGINANLKAQVDAIWDKIAGGSGTKPIYPSDPPPVKG